MQERAVSTNLNMSNFLCNSVLSENFLILLENPVRESSKTWSALARVAIDSITLCAAVFLEVAGNNGINDPEFSIGGPVDDEPVDTGFVNYFLEQAFF